MPAKKKPEIVDKTFGILVVTDLRFSRHGGRRRWFAKCVCKKCSREFWTLVGGLLAGRTKSCYCQRRKHGMTRTRIYRAWCDMMARCYSKACRNFRYYGAKNVKVCERWHNFENFLEDMGLPPKGMSLDRINPSGDYEPNNCRWADQETQNRNKRKTKYIEHDGKKLTIGQLAKMYGLCDSVLRHRLRRNSIEVALNQPVAEIKRYPYKGKMMTRRAIAHEMSVPYQTFISATHRMSVAGAIKYFMDRQQ